MSHTTEKSNRGFRMEVVDYMGDRAYFGFNTDIGRGGWGSDNLPGIGVRTDGGPVVRIAGQDLTALRDAILSLPDEAFPSPPYVSPNGWVEGDIVAFKEAPETVYVRDADAWTSKWDTLLGADKVLDRAIDDLIANGSHVASRQGGVFAQ